MLEAGDVDATLLFLSSIGFNERMMAQIREVLIEILDKHAEALLVASVMVTAADKALLEAHRVLHIEDPSRAVALIGVLARLREAFERPAAEAATSPAGDGPRRAGRGGERGRRGGIAARRRLAGGREPAGGLARGGRGGGGGARWASRAQDRLGRDPAQVRGRRGPASPWRAREEVGAAHDAILASAARMAPGARIDGVMVAPMVAGGVECILGTSTNPVFGPVVAFGLGGIFVEVLRDVTFRVAPFGLDEARRMIREVEGYPLLEGARGQAAADTEALAEALARLSVFAANNRETVESVDLNPVLAGPDRVVALDALVVPKTA